jgi:hypothetical protein
MEHKVYEGKIWEPQKMTLAEAITEIEEELTITLDMNPRLRQAYELIIYNYYKL